MIAVQPPAGNVAVILPIGYQGGTLRLVLNVVRHFAARGVQRLVFGVPAGHIATVHDDLARLRRDLPVVEVRAFTWKTLDRSAARARAAEAGLEVGDFISDTYQLPIDEASGFCDCDFWFFVSDRLEYPLVPLRPYGILVTDHLQRYVPEIFDLPMYQHQHAIPWNFLRNVRNADVVVSTSAATAADVASYSGALGRQLRMPTTIDIEYFQRLASGPATTADEATRPPYFAWVTNSSPHKNHLRMVRALRTYYGSLGGSLDVRVTGLWTDLFDPDLPEARIGPRRGIYDLPYVREVREAVRTLLGPWRDRVHLLGAVPDAEYVRIVRESRFLLHNVLADNGTFSVVEAGILGRPAVSSDYPQMREIDASFGLGLRFFDPCDEASTAAALLEGEQLPAPAADALVASIARRSWRTWDDAIVAAIGEILAEPRRPIAFL
jgi:glycosyltransferase involved in cell wall biosynthesis